MYDFSSMGIVILHMWKLKSHYSKTYNWLLLKPTFTAPDLVKVNVNPSSSILEAENSIFLDFTTNLSVLITLQKGALEVSSK